MKRLTKLLLIIAITSFGLESYAQKTGYDYGTGQDSIKCLENLSIYQHRYQNEEASKNFSPETYKAWRGAFFGCPQGSQNMYLPHGVNMFTAKVKSAKNKEEKQKYIDTIMMIYDRRIEYFGDENQYIGWKGADLFMLDQSQFEEAFAMLKKSFDALGAKTDIKTMIILMQSSLSRVKKGTMQKSEALALYQQLDEVFAAKIAAGSKGHASWRPKLEALFLKLDPACSDLVELFQPQYDADPENIEVLKKITNYLGDDCQNEALFLNAAVSLDKLEPSALSKRNIANMYEVKGNKAEAINYYKQSIELEEDNAEKAEMYYSIANLTIYTPSTCVSYLNQAISFNPQLGKAYVLKAQQYVSGNSACTEGAEFPIVETWKSYWAAVDLLEKAKSIDPSIAGTANSKISQYKAFFPSSEEMFDYSIYEGNSQSISCWYSATTTARAK